MIADAGTPARYIMIGGFLGAGKTTAVARLGRYLVERGMRVGLISNDQSTGLVDTAMLRAKGFDVEEIAGGCFCCRFQSLLDAASRLTAANSPDVFIAEPVGSCTDLIATVSYPLRRIYGDRFVTAPLSVLVDPTRCARILGLSDGRSFSHKVVYVYRKQLEEAGIIVINKCDAIEDGLRSRLAETLRATFSRSKVRCCSAREGPGLSEWFDHLLAADGSNEPTLSLDYDRYAEGEALLGWLNGTFIVTSDCPFDANQLLLSLAGKLRAAFHDRQLEIAHLKMTLDTGGREGNLCMVSLVSSAEQPDLRESLFDRVEGGELIINLRAEADPDLLKTFTIEALATSIRAERGLSFSVEHLEHFRPARPSPTHRFTVSESGS